MKDAGLVEPPVVIRVAERRSTSKLKTRCAPGRTPVQERIVDLPASRSPGSGHELVLELVEDLTHLRRLHFGSKLSRRRHTSRRGIEALDVAWRSSSFLDVRRRASKFDSPLPAPDRERVSRPGSSPDELRGRAWPSRSRAGDPDQTSSKSRSPSSPRGRRSSSRRPTSSRRIAPGRDG